MKLELSALGALSSWASVLQAYENWILTDDNPTRRSLAARLMSSVPLDAGRAPRPPAAEFTTLVDLAEPELLKVKQAEQNRVLHRDPQLAVVRRFWSQSLPSALRLRVGATTKSLVDLREQVEITHGLGE
jgi:hypothetical protein